MPEDVVPQPDVELGVAERFSRVLIAALAVVTNDNGQVLFVHQQRGPFAGSWLLPGGGLEREEDAVSSVRRETFEETGVRVDRLDFVRTYEIFGSWRHGPFHIVMLTFSGRANGDIPESFRGHNVGEVRWAAPEEIELHPTDLRILADAGVRRFSESQIEAALARDGLRMVGYP